MQCIYVYLFTLEMKNKKIRLEAIREIINTSTIRNQDDLLQALISKGFELTQATLSRDLKQMKVAKQPTEDGNYTYILPLDTQNIQEIKTSESTDVVDRGFVSIDFSGNLAVIKTRPGYASSIAYDIDNKQFSQFLGSIAGDDTVLLIIREGISKDIVLEVLSSVISDIR